MKAATEHVPGEIGIWIVILGDAIVFVLMFLTFMFYRRADLPVFQSSQLHLDQTFGLLNTLFMLSSSWFVALSVQAARTGHRARASTGFILALSCGLAFSIIKVLEYRQKMLG